jgi:hypothetical protein
MGGLLFYMGIDKLAGFANPEVVAAPTNSLAKAKISSTRLLCKRHPVSK